MSGWDLIFHRERGPDGQTVRARWELGSVCGVDGIQGTEYPFWFV